MHAVENVVHPHEDCALVLVRARREMGDTPPGKPLLNGSWRGQLTALHLAQHGQHALQLGVGRVLEAATEQERFPAYFIDVLGGDSIALNFFGPYFNPIFGPFFSHFFEVAY